MVSCEFLEKKDIFLVANVVVFAGEPVSILGTFIELLSENKKKNLWFKKMKKIWRLYAFFEFIRTSCIKYYNIIKITFAVAVIIYVNVCMVWWK